MLAGKKWFVTGSAKEVYNGQEWLGSGWRLVHIKWLHLQNPGVSDYVPRRYKVVHTQATIQCNSITGPGSKLLKEARARTPDKHFAFDRKTGEYVMHPSLHAKIEQYGQIN